MKYEHMEKSVSAIICIPFRNQYIKITYSPFCSFPNLANINFRTNIKGSPHTPCSFCAWILCKEINI